MFITNHCTAVADDTVVSTIWKVWQSGGRVLRYSHDRGPQARVQSISPKNISGTEIDPKYNFSDPTYPNRH